MMSFLGTIGVAFDDTMITKILGYVGDVFDDLDVYILLILGVGLGLIVISAIINALRGH